MKTSRRNIRKRRYRCSNRQNRERMVRLDHCISSQEQAHCHQRILCPYRQSGKGKKERGRILEDFFAGQLLECCQQTSKDHPYAEEAGRTENIHATAATKGIINRIETWKLEDWAINDHRASHHLHNRGKRKKRRHQRTNGRKWY